jgi:hypothetical protein
VRLAKTASIGEKSEEMTDKAAIHNKDIGASLGQISNAIEERASVAPADWPCAEHGKETRKALL